MPYHIERFIHEVEEMPGVWDKSRKDYEDRDKRLMRWKRIAENLHYLDWKDYSEKKREKISKRSVRCACIVDLNCIVH